MIRKAHENTATVACSGSGARFHMGAKRVFTGFGLPNRGTVLQAYELTNDCVSGQT